MNDNIRRIGSYSVEKICSGVYAIDDDQEESMYLVCGSEKALLIDTGSNPEPVTPVIRELWSGPVELVLTHAHFDHMYHCDEFSSVSLGAKDICAWKTVLKYIVWLSTAGSGKKPKHYRMNRYHPLNHGDVIDLGGKVLRIADAKGHTPGSIMIIDEEDKCLFTGDVFGWMWMPGCSCLSEYISSLKSIINELAKYPDFVMLDGHRQQLHPFHINGRNKLPAFAAGENMKRLCEKIMSGKLNAVESVRYFGIRTYTYRDDDAVIVLCKNKLK